MAVLGPDILLFVLSGAGMLALAGWLLSLDHRSVTNRLFAAVLLLRGALNLAFAGSRAGPGWPWADAIVGASEHAIAALAILVPLAAIAFALEYRNTYGVTRRVHVPVWPFLTAGTLFVVAYAAEPRLWIDGATAGPLFLAAGLAFLSYAVVALLLAYEYVHAPPGPVRRSLMLVGLGFALNPAFTATTELFLVDLGNAPFPLAGPWATASHVLGDLALVPVAALLFLLLRDAAKADDPHVGPEVTRATALVLLAIASAVAGATAYFLYGPETGTRWLGGAEAVWDLALPLLVTYALLRHELFDINIKLKATVKRSVLAGSFAMVFFLVSEVLELFVPADSNVAGIVAAGFISLLLAPIQKVSQRLADRLMPGVKELDEMGLADRRRLYRDQVRIAAGDGTIDEKDRRMLAVAREALRLSSVEAQRIEDEALAQAAQSAEELAATSAG